ncbi:MAG: NAD(P)H-binding protein [Pseudomonadales bacterium]|nr:NAD(P)H-binding protein [Pseudomonadales bacterium]
MKKAVILVTGANGNLGRRLVGVLRAQGVPVRALVRRADAVAAVGATGPDLEVRVVDYLDAEGMRAAAAGCSQVVHLVGILKESARSLYEDSHERTSRVLVDAAAQGGVQRIIYLSIVGSTPDSSNPCLASKGRAEQILLAGQVPALVLRVPMVLGEGDYASRALRQRAGKRLNLLLRAASLEQPIYAGDVIEAIRSGIAGAGLDDVVLDLAGPESLSRGELVQRAANLLGRQTRVLSIPLAAGLALAWLFETLLPDPPVTRAMLGVLDHDDDLDPAASLDRLGIELTDLSLTLRRVLASQGPTV